MHFGQKCKTQNCSYLFNHCNGISWFFFKFWTLRLSKAINWTHFEKKKKIEKLSFKIFAANGYCRTISSKQYNLTNCQNDFAVVKNASFWILDFWLKNAKAKYFEDDSFIVMRRYQWPGIPVALRQMSIDDHGGNVCYCRNFNLAEFGRSLSCLSKYDNGSVFRLL